MADLHDTTAPGYDPSLDSANPQTIANVQSNIASQNARSLAYAGDPAPKDPSVLPTLAPAAQIAPAVQMDAATRSIDPTTGTVQGQLGSMLDSGSPLMERAGAKGMMAANDRGLINSSMGVQAGQAAMIDAATPIATSDAGAYNTAAGQNQANTQQVRQVNAAAQNQINSLNAAATNTNNTTSFNAGVDMAKINRQGIINKGIQDSQNETTLANTNLNNANATKVAAVNDQSGLSKAAMDAIQANNANKDMTPDVRAAANQTITNNFKTLADFTAATASIPGLASGLKFNFSTSTSPVATDTATGMAVLQNANGNN